MSGLSQQSFQSDGVDGQFSEGRPSTGGLGLGHRLSHLLLSLQRLSPCVYSSTWLARFTHLSLGHQLPLGCRGRFDQGTRGSSNGFSSFQNLFFKVQGLVCLLEQKKMTSHAIRIHKGRFLPNYLLLGHLALHPFITFLLTNHTQVERPKLAKCLSIGCLPLAPF